MIWMFSLKLMNRQINDSVFRPLLVAVLLIAPLRALEPQFSPTEQKGYRSASFTVG